MSKMLQFVIKTENYLCIYRNYYFYGRFIRALILVRILLEISIAASFIVMYVSLYKNEHTINNIFFIIGYFNSIAQIVLPWYKGCTFKKFLYHLNSVSQYLKFSNFYIKKMTRKQFKIKCIITVVICLEIGMLIYNCISPMYSPINQFTHSPLSIIAQISSTIIILRYNLEYLILSSVLVMISVQLEGLMHCIDKQATLNTSPESTDDVLPTPRPSHQKEIEYWSVIYTHITESSKLLNSIFGTQLTFMLVIAVIFYVTEFYFLADLNVKGQGSSLSLNIQFVQVIVQAMIYFYTLASTAQEAENNVDALKQQLSKYIIGAIKYELEYKAMRDLLRLVMTRPIRTKAFGSIDINMSLLPTLISFITSYTVIALQFNNVV